MPYSLRGTKLHETLCHSLRTCLNPRRNSAQVYHAHAQVVSTNELYATVEDEIREWRERARERRKETQVFCPPCIYYVYYVAASRRCVSCEYEEHKCIRACLPTHCCFHESGRAWTRNRSYTLAVLLGSPVCFNRQHSDLKDIVQLANNLAFQHKYITRARWFLKVTQNFVGLYCPLQLNCPVFQFITFHSILKPLVLNVFFIL